MSIPGTITLQTRSRARSASSPAAPPLTAEPARHRLVEPTRAEMLECTCPDFCERDHEQD